MTTPNEYIDLRVFDKDAQDIFDAAVQYLRLRLPDWEPREDATEAMLMEAMALEVAESAFVLNRLPSTIMMNLLTLFGLKRKEGSYPTTTITVSVNRPGLNIPAGTRFTLNTSLYDEPIVFTTTEAAYFNNSTLMDVEAKANRLTDELYSVPVGTRLLPVETNNALEDSVIGSPIIGGSLPETDKEWMDRSVGHFQRLVSTLVTPDHFRLAALDYEPVERVKVIDLYDPAVNVINGSPGHITVSVYGNNRMLTDQERATLLNELQSRALASLQIHVVNPTIFDFNVTASVGYMPNVIRTDVNNKVAAALREFLASIVWINNTKIRRNEIITAISNVPGVDYVAELTVPATDIDTGQLASMGVPGTFVIHGEDEGV